MKKRIIAITMMIVMTLASAIGVTGCQVKNETVEDPKTINVLIYKAGYGTSYITAMKEKFEAAFADEGYKINVLNPKVDFHGSIMLQDVYSTKNNPSKVDLYFPGGLTAQQAVAGEYGVCVEDISDIFNMQPIKFDGTEETGGTIKQRIEDLLPVLDKTIEHEGKYYGVPYILDGSGLAVNTKVLNEAGITTLPVTTSELFAMSDKLMETINMGSAPWTYSGVGNGYPSALEQNWFAQYEGLDSYNEFWSWENADGSRMDCTVKGCDGSSCGGHAYEVWDKEGIIEMFAAIYETFDPNRQARGVMQQDFKAAQSQLVTGKAAFYAVSGWMYNEEIGTYPEQMKDVYFIKIPLISALGPKLDLCGKGHVDVAKECFEDCADCEALLAQIVRLSDEKKTAEEIKTALSKDVAIEKIETIMERRNYQKNSSGSSAWINAYTTQEKKDIAKLFLRMMASTEGGALMAQHTSTVNPFNRFALKDSEYKWLQQTTAAFNDPNAIFYESGVVTGSYRAKCGVVSCVPVYSNILSFTFAAQEVSIFDRAQDYKKVGDRSLYREKAEIAMWGDGKDVEGAYVHAKNNVENRYWRIPD